MTTPAEPKPPRLSLEALARIDEICTRFEQALQQGGSPAAEGFLAGSEGPERQQLLLELLLLELAHCRPSQIGELQGSYESRFPSDHHVIRKALQKHRQLLGVQQGQHESVRDQQSPKPETDCMPPAGIPRRLRYLEDYELLEEIARGGMGIVYKARDRRDNRFVAVKMLLLGEHATAEQSERFIREAKTASRLEHPNIVPVYEVGYRDGAPYFVMDYVEGENLESFHGQQPVSELQAVQFVKTAAQAVSYAHQLGILHRDLKPSNLLVDQKLRLRITDFGLAKWMGEGESLTRTGEIMGTPGFMPPEQATGKNPESRTGFESDVYGLGAILYYLLTGRAPHQGDSVIDVINKVVYADPPAPRSLRPSISPDLEAICLKCLQKNPRKRYPSAAELARDLENWLLREPVSATLAKSASRPPHLLKQFAVTFAATALGLLLFVVLSRWGQWFSAGNSTAPAVTNAESPRTALASTEKPNQSTEASNTDAVEPPHEEIIPLRAPKPEIAAVTEAEGDAPAKPGAGPQAPIFPGGLFGPFAKPAWTMAPRDTRAMTVVHNMQDFSDKLDHHAEMMGREAPRVLRFAMDQANIDPGLKRDGALITLAAKPTPDGTPIAYLLPATRFESMTMRLDPREIKPPHKLKGYTRVTVNNWPFLAKPSAGYGLFVEEPWEDWADQINRSRGGFDQKLGPFSPYLRRQDIGFVLTREAIAEGVSIQLPFSHGDYVVPKAMQEFADLFFDLSGFTALGGGTRLTPLTGITVSGAAAIDPQSRAAQWHQSMQYDRDALLHDLPNVPTALVIAGCSCDEWNRNLEGLYRTQFGSAMDFSGLRAVALQIAAKPDPASLSELIHVQIKVDDANRFFADLQNFLPVVFQNAIANNEVALQPDRQANRQILRLSINPDVWPSLHLADGFKNFSLAISVYDQHTVMIQGVSAAYNSVKVEGKVSLNQVIEDLKQQTESLADNPQYRKSLDMLFPDSQQIVLCDVYGASLTVQGIFAMIQGTASTNTPATISGFTMPFETAPPLAMGSRFTSEMVEADVVAPNDLLKPLGALGSLFR